MRFTLAFSFLFAGLAGPSFAQGESAPAAPEVEVMVLGTFHWANPGRDAVNMQVDDVLSPRRQREIAVLAQTLALWQPTRIAVEWRAAPPAQEIPEYAEVEMLLRESRNESVQLGFRLADMLGHDAVYGFDEQPEDGEPDYFPMGAVQEFATASGQAHIIEGLIADLKAEVAIQQEQLAQQSMAESLILHNDAAVVEEQHDLLYYSMLQIGDGDSQPGAELNAYWYMRNAKMFAKLDLFAQPGDRVLVIVGSGHATWLRHFVARTPGYRLVEPMTYLLGAAAASEIAAR